jgi:orotate phosphoribosyltransferase
MTRTQQGWIDEYRKRSAYWSHDGNPKRPHAELASGNHSSGFFNSRLVIPDEALMRDAASDLLALFESQGGTLTDIECVVGPQTGATMLAKYMSETVTAITGQPCLHYSPAKHEEGGVKSMVFTSEEFTDLCLRQVLLCEDVLTTGGSVDLTAKVVDDAAGVILPFVAVLVNRSGLAQASGRKIVSLIERHMPIWAPGECPLCKAGSQAIKPKGENWALLNAEY